LNYGILSSPLFEKKKYQGGREPAVEQVVRILQVLGSLEMGGAEVMIMNLYRHIDRSRIQFDFIVHTPTHGLFEDEVSDRGGRVYRVPRFTGFNILHYLQAWEEFFTEHQEYHIIHGHVASSSAIYLGIARRHHVYTIAHSHSMRLFHGIKGVMDRLFSYPTRWIADQFFACSRDAGSARFGQKIVDSSKFRIIQNAMEVASLAYNQNIRDALRSKLGLEDRLVIGHVGRFDLMKNHEFLIQVFRLIFTCRPDAVLLLVGDGEQRPVIENLIKTFSLDDAVILLGIRNDVPQLLQAMDVFVFPSLAEGLGISVIEAQASGLPCVVSTQVPKEVGVTQLVEFLELKESKETWADTIIRVVKGHERASHVDCLTANGYDVTKSAEDIQAFYLNAYNTKERVHR
jgi:glycosyltransferase involved in cell wall biosynthesis